MEIEDITKSIKATLYERVSNPFILSFLAAWCIHNYRIIMIAFSDESLNSKLVKIDFQFEYNVLVSGMVFNLGGILHGLIIPFMYTLIYICVLPYLSKPINQIHFTKQSELLSAKQKAEGLELLTKEKSRELRQEIIILEKKYSEKVQILEQENSELRRIISNTDTVSNSEHNETTNNSIELTDDELTVLSAFSDHDRRSAAEVAQDTKIRLERVKLICTDLMQKAFLSVNASNSQGQYLFALEQLGRKYLNDRNLL